MNLSEISEKFYSHPNYPYNLHVQNISDSFQDTEHKLTAMYHDLGKLSDEFQEYIRGDRSKKTNHALIGAIVFFLSTEGHFNENNLAVFFSIIWHHQSLENISTYIYDVLSDEDFIKERDSSIQDRLGLVISRSGLEIDGSVDLEEICDSFNQRDYIQQNGFTGLDNYFRIKEIFSKLIFADKYEAIFKEKFIDEIQIDSDFFLKRLESIIDEKKNQLSDVRNKARREILDSYIKKAEKKIHIIEAPTGMGKTFMSLHLALEIQKRKNKKRIITALPMTSIIDQTYDEYLNIFSEAELLKYHHLTYSKDYLMDHDEKEGLEQKNEFIKNSWALDSVIVTTFNQILNCFYSNKNKDLVKFWTLRNSVIILDEIQNIPRILLQDFANVISFLSSFMDIDFILMSATIPSVKNFIPKYSYSDLLSNKYYAMDFNNKYRLTFNKTINSPEGLTQEVCKAAEKQSSVLAVVNTKKLALQVYNELAIEFKESLFLLSANFIPMHRIKIIETIKERLANNIPTILISTQIIEAGVDLDFDIGFREFGPFSSIIQTAGRVNREGKKGQSELIVTGKIGASPYHPKDVSYDEVSDLIATGFQAAEGLPFIKKYFETVISKTSPDPILIREMENLNYQNVAKLFDENYMQNLPFIGPVFIEIEDSLFEKFHKRQKELIESMQEKELKLEEKMTQKIKYRNLFKEMAHYIINVPASEIRHFPTIWNGSDIRLCPNTHVGDKREYSSQRGWQANDGDMMW